MPHAYTLGFLELTFILVMILLLHSARRLIGNSGFYLALGSLMVLAQILTAVDLKIVVGEDGHAVNMGPIFFIPFMAALLITYTLEGTNEAQRRIVGFAIVNFMDAASAPEISVLRISVGVFLITTVPVIIGMAVRHFWTPFAIDFERWAKIIASVLFVIIILFIVVSGVYYLRV